MATTEVAPPNKPPRGKGITRRFGPLPLWGYALVGGGAYLVYYLYEAHLANVAASTGTAGTADTPVSPDYTSTGAATTGSPTVSGAGAKTSEWLSKAVHELTLRGVGNAAALSAVEQYLAGNPITNSTLADDLRAVVKNLGTPPGQSNLTVRVKTLPKVENTHTASETPKTATTATGKGTILPKTGTNT